MSLTILPQGWNEIPRLLWTKLCLNDDKVYSWKRLALNIFILAIIAVAMLQRSINAPIVHGFHLLLTPGAFLTIFFQLVWVGSSQYLTLAVNQTSLREWRTLAQFKNYNEVWCITHFTNEFIIKTVLILYKISVFNLL